MTKSQRYMSR